MSVCVCVRLCTQLLHSDTSNLPIYIYISLVIHIYVSVCIYLYPLHFYQSIDRFFSIDASLQFFSVMKSCLYM